MLYKNPRWKIRVNGRCSDSFDIERGVRQGDSLSSILFPLSIERLAEAIRQDVHIGGVEDGVGRIHKISLFADDILLFIKHPLTSIFRLMQCLKDYGDISGYKINQNKSETMMVSGMCPNQLNETFHWFNKLLGTWVLFEHLKPQKLFEANYNKLIKQVRSILTGWEVLPPSLFGRVQTVRINLLPRLLFLFQSLPIRVPSFIFTTLNKIISQFIWQQKRPRIRLKILHLAKNKEGPALPNLKLYYWAAHLAVIVTWISGDKEAKWTQ